MKADIGASVTAFFAGVPVEEWPRSRKFFWLPVNGADPRAVKGDPRQCVLALAGDNMLGPGSRGSLFYRSKAYLHFPAEGYIYRFRLPNDTMRAVDLFDRTDVWPADVVVVRLDAPTRTQTREGKLAYRRTQKPRNRRVVRSSLPRALVRGSSAYIEKLEGGDTT